MQKNKFSFDFYDKEYVIEFGHIGFNSDVCFLLTCRGTSVLLNLVIGKEDTALDFFPLTVEYIEKLYASGQIASSPYIKNEGKPNDHEILHARLIDHAIRSLFPSDLRREVQIVCQVVSYDGVVDPVLVSIVGVSFAITYSGLPFLGPYGTTKIGYKNGDFLINADLSEFVDSEMEMFVSSVEKGIVSIEADIHNLSDEIVKEAIKIAHERNFYLIEKQKEFVNLFSPKTLDIVKEKDESLLQPYYDEIYTTFKNDIEAAIYVTDKKNRENNIRELYEKIKSHFTENFNDQQIDENVIKQAFEKAQKKIVRSNIIDYEKRPDGRKLDEIRSISIQVGVLPSVHGSSLFTRGETQSLTVVTLGTDQDALIYQNLEGDLAKRYFHHYNMPGYANGEIDRKIGFQNRRAIGHGAIGEKSLKNVLPKYEEFPYTIRVVSEIVSSNGSTSMAATCGSTLALMDAGVPIRDVIGGIGVGLVYESEEKYKILTDIINIEDFYGDMDFKITGSERGITAIQLDNKLSGIPIDIILEAIDASARGRKFVIEQMKKYISSPRSKVADNAPKVKIIKINPEKIAELIGPGGKNIKDIIEKTNTEIKINPDGTVIIYGREENGLNNAVQQINNIGFILDENTEYQAEVIRVEEYGAIVQILNTNTFGLIHISTFNNSSDHKFVKIDLNKVFKVGDLVKVKYIGNDVKGRPKFRLAQ
ncbi:MAG: polyribonucleotide nucleotidyltransferase [Candidatus Dojkabacteria bacterium]|nr:polyribonucleotide nucleotidyltransferase [Candidatus Dojkabacteria bacterium]